MAEFGSSLKGLLAKKRLTITELSAAVKIPVKSIQEWILNNRFPRDPELIKRIADYLGCSVHMLIYGSEDPKALSIDNVIEKITLHSGLYEISIRRVKEYED